MCRVAGGGRETTQGMAIRRQGSLAVFGILAAVKDKNGKSQKPNKGKS
jgi:hypothetical protein